MDPSGIELPLGAGGEHHQESPSGERVGAGLRGRRKRKEEEGGETEKGEEEKGDRVQGKGEEARKREGGGKANETMLPWGALPRVRRSPSSRTACGPATKFFCFVG